MHTNWPGPDRMAVVGGAVSHTMPIKRRLMTLNSGTEPGIVIITYYDYGDYKPTLIWHTVPQFGGALSPSVHNIGAYYTYAAWALA